MDIIKTLSEELNIPADRIEKTVALIDEGNTIPFIARYRKEVTGSLDDIALRALFDRLTYLRKLDERRAEISNAIENQGKLTEEITHALAEFLPAEEHHSKECGFHKECKDAFNGKRSTEDVTNKP